MSFSFRYRKELFEGKAVYYPHIPITLFNEGIQLETTGLLDSGSTHIFIPSELAKVLSLRLGKADFAQSWGGKLPIKESRVGILLGKGSQTFRKILPCMVAPADNKGPPLIILGRELFQFFDVTFKENERLTMLKTPAKK